MSNAFVILGGMGPQATAEVHERLVHESALLVAKTGQSFPELVLLSLPVPDFFANQANMAAALEMLVDRAGRAMVFEPQMVMMACNTAHLLQSDLLSQIPELPFVSLIDTVAETIAGQNKRKIGLLASPTTIETKLYQDALETKGIGCQLPSASQLKQLEIIINNTIQGSAKNHRPDLQRLIDDMFTAGCDAVLLGCTELPVVHGRKPHKNVFDSVSILCQSILDAHFTKSAIMEAS